MGTQKKDCKIRREIIGESKMEKERLFWVVVNNRFPTSISYKHDTFESAENEAKRLARCNKGEKFVVLRSTTAYEVSEFIKTQYSDWDDCPF